MMRTSSVIFYTSQLSIATASLQDIPWTKNFDHHFAPQLENITCYRDHDHGHDRLPIFPSLDFCPSTQEPPSLDLPTSSWTFPRICTDVENITEPFCTYTSPTFDNGRGLSLLTKPHIAQEIAASVADLAPFTPATAKNPPPYEIRPLPGRGMGVIANRTIFAGEELFAHRIFGIFNYDAFVWPTSPSYAGLLPLFHKAASQLPEKSNKLLYGLGKHDEEADLTIGILDTNTFAAVFGGEDHMVIVPETARMNHDCRPNAMYYLDQTSLVHYTHASRTIHIGEEITINYIDPLQSYHNRQSAIKNGWGFTCTCSHCLMPPDKRDESDRRIALIKNLNAEFLDDFVSSEADDAEDDVAKAELLISLFEQERLWGAMEDAYRSAALAYSRLGKHWKSVKWAMKAAESALLVGGVNGGVQEMRRMTEWVEEYFSG